MSTFKKATSKIVLIFLWQFLCIFFIGSLYITGAIILTFTKDTGYLLLLFVTLFGLLIWMQKQIDNGNVSFPDNKNPLLMKYSANEEFCMKIFYADIVILLIGLCIFNYY